MRTLATACLTAALTLVGAIGALHAADDAAAKAQLAPTGKLRVGIAVASTPGAGNVARDAEWRLSRRGGGPGSRARRQAGRGGRACAVSELRRTDRRGRERRLGRGVPARRRPAQDQGGLRLGAYRAAEHVPGGGRARAIATLADADKPGVRVAGVEGTATARAAQASLKTVTMTLVKTADDLFDLLKSGRADAIALSRESLLGLSAKLPGSRVLDGAFLNSYVAVAVPKGKPAALAYASAFIDGAVRSGSVRRALDSIGLKTSRCRHRERSPRAGVSRPGTAYASLPRVRLRCRTGGRRTGSHDPIRTPLTGSSAFCGSSSFRLAAIHDSMFRRPTSSTAQDIHGPATWPVRLYERTVGASLSSVQRPSWPSVRLDRSGAVSTKLRVAVARRNASRCYRVTCGQPASDETHLVGD